MKEKKFKVWYETKPEFREMLIGYHKKFLDYRHNWDYNEKEYQNEEGKMFQFRNHILYYDAHTLFLNELMNLGHLVAVRPVNFRILTVQITFNPNPYWIKNK